MTHEEIRQIMTVLCFSESFCLWCKEHYNAVYKSIIEKTNKYENWYEIVLEDYNEYLENLN